MAKSLKRILSYISEYKWSVIFSVLFAAITVALTLYAPILVGRAIDYILAPGQVDFITISKILMILLLPACHHLKLKFYPHFLLL